jgi:hypothetical protein
LLLARVNVVESLILFHATANSGWCNFLGALAYVGRLILRSFQAKSACASGCGKCGAVDFQKIEAQIKKGGL